MFFNFSSAFNTIRSDWLCQKLHKTQVETSTVTWINVYLTNRTRYDWRVVFLSRRREAQERHKGLYSNHFFSLCRPQTFPIFYLRLKWGIRTSIWIMKLFLQAAEIPITSDNSQTCISYIVVHSFQYNLCFCVCVNYYHSWWLSTKADMGLIWTV